MLTDLKSEDVWCVGAVSYSEKSTVTDTGSTGAHSNDNFLPSPAVTQVVIWPSLFISLIIYGHVYFDVLINFMLTLPFLLLSLTL